MLKREPDVNYFCCAGSLKSRLERIITFELCSKPEFHKDKTDDDGISDPANHGMCR